MVSHSGRPGSKVSALSARGSAPLVPQSALTRMTDQSKIAAAFARLPPDLADEFFELAASSLEGSVFSAGHLRELAALRCRKSGVMNPILMKLSHGLEGLRERFNSNTEVSGIPRQRLEPLDLVLICALLAQNDAITTVQYVPRSRPQVLVLTVDRWRSLSNQSFTVAAAHALGLALRSNSRLTRLKFVPTPPGRTVGARARRFLTPTTGWPHRG